MTIELITFWNFTRHHTHRSLLSIDVKATKENKFRTMLRGVKHRVEKGNATCIDRVTFP